MIIGTASLTALGIFVLVGLVVDEYCKIRAENRDREQRRAAPKREEWGPGRDYIHH